MKFNIPSDDYAVVELPEVPKKRKKPEAPKAKTSDSSTAPKQEVVESEKAVTKTVENESSAKESKKGPHPGGRPTNESKGKATRKQYTLTLKEEDYINAMKQADSEDISFAKLVEKALKQYIGY